MRNPRPYLERPDVNVRFEAPPPQSRLRDRALKAGAWNLGAHGFEILVRLTSNLIMTRLLFPEAFGVVAAALALMTGLALVSDFGVRTLIIQSTHGDQTDFLRSAWTFQLWRGTVLWLILCAVCAILVIPVVHNIIPATSVFASQTFPLVTSVLGFSLVLGGAESTAISLNVRRLNFSPIVSVDLACRILPLPVMFACALVAPSVWTLVAGIMAGNILRLALSHLIVPGPRMAFRWDKKHFVEIVKFGKWIAVSTMGSFVSQQSDVIILGLVLPGSTFGVYVIAKMLVDTGEGLLERLNGALTLPILSEVVRKDPRDIRDRYYRFRLPIELGAAILSGLLFATGDLIVQFLYDPRYAQAGPMAQVLALGVAMYPVLLIRSAFMATGDTHIVAGVSVLQAVSLILCMFGGLAITGSPMGAIFGIATHRIIPSLAILVLAAKRNWIDPWLELRIVPAFVFGVVTGEAIVVVVAALGVSRIRYLLQ